MTDIVGGVAVEVTADASSIPAEVTAAAQAAMEGLNAAMRAGLAEAAAQLDLFGANSTEALNLSGLTDAASKFGLFREQAQAALEPTTEEMTALGAAINVARDAAAGYASGGGAALDAALEANVVAARGAQAAMDEAFGVLGGAADRIPSVTAGGVFSGMFAGLKSGAADAAGFMTSTLTGAFESVANVAKTQLSAAFDGAKAAASGLAVVLVAGVAGGLYEGLKAANQFAKVQDTFTAITGSAEQSRQIIVSLRQTAIETGQSFENISRFSQQLLAAGVQGVPQIANALAVYATAFGRNTQSMQRAATQLQEIQLKGTLQAQQLNALVRDGVPAYQAATVAAEKLGLAQKGAADEGSQVTDAMKAGKISAQAFFDALSDPSVISKASATVAALNTNIGFQLQKLQTEMVHTLGQIFTPLFQTLGAAVEPITAAMAKITLDAPGLQAVGNIIASLFNATVANWAKEVGDGISYVADQLERLGKNQSVGDVFDKIGQAAPSIEFVAGLIGTIGAKGLASFVPFLNIGLNPVVAGFVTMALGAKSVRDDFGLLFEDAGKLAGILGNVLAPVMSTMQGIFNTFASGAQPALQSISGFISDLGSALQSGNTAQATTAAQGIGTSIGDAVEGAVQNGLTQIDWSKVGAGLGKSTGTIAKVLGDILNSAFETIDWASLGQLAGEKAPAFVGAFTKTFASIAGPSLIEWASGGAGISVEGFANALMGGELAKASQQAVGGFVTTVFGDLGSTISGLWGQVLSAHIPADNPINDFFNNLGSSIKKILDGIGTDIGDFFSGLGGKVEGALSGFVSDVVGWFENLANQLVGHSVVPDMITAIVAEFARLPGEVLGVIVGFVGSVVDHFASMASGAAAQAAAMVGAVAGQVGSMVGNVIGQIAGMVGSAIGQAAAMAGGVAGQVYAMAGAAIGAAANFVGNIVNGIRNGIGSAASAAGDLVNAAIKAAQNAVSGLTSIGASIGQGIESGIKSTVQDVANAAAAVVNAAKSAANAAAGNPSSPAPVFIPLGQSIGQGIAAGIDQSVAGIQQSSQAAVQAAMVAMQGGYVTGGPAGSATAAPGGSGGVSITNNAYGPDPASVISELNRQQQFKLAALGVA